MVERVDGLAVRTLGSGPGLILLHGFTGSGEAWPDRAIASLADHLTCALIDLPGHGASRLPADPAEWTLARTLDRLAAVQDACFGEPVAWMGYSMGGRIALSAAASGLPMRALLLESASPGLATEEERAARRVRDAELGRRIEHQGMAAFVDEWVKQPLFASQSRLPVEVRAAERARRLKNDPGQLALALQGLGTGAQPSWHDRLDALTMPVSLITGELDDRFTTTARMMASAIPNVSTRVVNDAGHAVHLEAPEAWADWVLAAALHREEE